MAEINVSKNNNKTLIYVLNETFYIYLRRIYADLVRYICVCVSPS
jgi:hypothetical protein